MLPLSQEDIVAIQLVVNSQDAIQATKRATAALDDFVNKAAQAKALGALPATVSQNNIKAVENLTNRLKEVAPATNSATKGLFSLRNMARTALGTFEAMAIFFVTQFIGGAIKKTIDAVTQLEQAFYRLTIAEKSLSASGVDISPRDLANIASEISKTYQTVSKIDSLKMISNLAVLTKDLKLTSEEYKKLALAIPLVAQQAGVTIESATEQVITGLTKSGRGWADLGITVDAEIIKQEAVHSGLVANRQAYEDLTAEQKQQVEVLALINILQKNTVENLSEQSTYLESISGKTALVNRLWEEFITLAGTTFAPAIEAGLEIAKTGLLGMVGAMMLFKSAYVISMSGFIGTLKTVQDILSGKGFSVMGMIQNIDVARKVLDTMVNPQLSSDTPTGNPPKVTPEDVGADDLAKALEKMNKEILDAQLKLQQDMEDAAIDLGRKLYDITIEYEQKRADAYRDYQSKVADINRDYSDKIAEINQRQAEAQAEAKQNELDKEREFQNRMQELKEKFLMDLDDALHARDARQILRLIKQYELEKLQAERQHELDKTSSAEQAKLRNDSFNADRKRAAEERKAKLAEAQQDFNDKLAKLALDEALEVQAANLAYERKKQDLEKAMHDRLEIVAANLVAEYNLTKEGLQAIANLYGQYYSQVAGIYAAMMGMFTGMQAMSGGGALTAAWGSTPATQSSHPGGGGAAEGGTFIANRPTTITFGEAGLEKATFTPLGRMGRDVSKTFTNVSGLGEGAGGKVSIELLLSPDLESRIISNSLNATAEVFTRVQRNKR